MKKKKKLDSSQKYTFGGNLGESILDQEMPFKADPFPSFFLCSQRDFQ